MNIAGENLIPELEKALIGKTITEAEESDASWMSIRPIMIDGEHMIVTQDWNLGRVNVEIENGVITKVNSVG